MQRISEYCWTVWLLKWRLLHLRSLSSNINSRLFLQSSLRPRVSFFVALTIWSRFKDFRRTSKTPCWRVVRMQKLCAQVHVPCLVSYMRKLICTSEKTLKVSIVSSTIPTQHSPYSSTASRQTMNFFTQFFLLHHLLPSAIALTLSAPSNATIPAQSNYQCFTSPKVTNLEPPVLPSRTAKQQSNNSPIRAPRSGVSTLAALPTITNCPSTRRWELVRLALTWLMRWVRRTACGVRFDYGRAG